MQAAHHSLFHLFAFFYLYFIPSFHSISSYFFLFSSYSMFDFGSVSTLYSCLFDVSIHLSSFFLWEPLGPGLMTFSMHCISCMRGMGVISLGSLSLVSIHFVHPITLAYVMSRVLRPPWGYYFALCLTAHTWAILEIGWRLFLRAWRVGVRARILAVREGGAFGDVWVGGRYFWGGSQRERREMRWDIFWIFFSIVWERGEPEWEIRGLQKNMGVAWRKRELRGRRGY